MKDIWTWASVHPWPAALIVATVIGTLLGRINTYYGDDHPRLRRHLLFAIDLLTSWLPNLWPQSKPKTSIPNTGVIVDKVKRIGIVLLTLLLLASCASWKSTVRKSLDTAGALANLAAYDIGLACDHVKEKCKTDKTNPCPALETCHKAERDVARTAVAIQAAVLVGLGAIDLADQARALDKLKQALKLLEPLKTTLKAYGVDL